MNIRLFGLLLFAVIFSGQMAQAQTPLVQLKAANYNPTTGVWTDSSGNGNNATATGAKPTLVTGVTSNGAPAVFFSASTPLTLSSTIPPSSGYTVFAYVKAAVGNGPWALCGGGSGSLEYRLYSSTANQVKQNVLNQAQADRGASTTTLVTTDFSLIDATTSTTGGGFRLNGVADGANNNTTSFNPGISYIAGNAGSDGESYRGYISEIDIYNGVLTAAQITNIEAQIASSYISGPYISAQPSNQGTYTGGNASFSVTASGPATLTYQWQATNSATGGFTNVPNSSPFSGVTSTTLTITGATAAQALTYQVVVANGSGSVTSSPASLAVADPVIVTQPANQGAAVGGSASFSVTAAGATTLSYQWQTNGGSGWANLGNGVQNDGATISGATGNVMTIAVPTGYWTNLTYQVIVSDTAGSVTSTPPATLTIGSSLSWNTTSGTWDTSSANWTGAGNVWVDNNNATFNNTATASTVTLSGSRTATAITIGGGNNNANFSFTGGTSLTAGSLTVQGAGGNNGTYSGNPTTTINVPNVSIQGDVVVGRLNFTISGGNFSANRIISGPVANSDWVDLTISGGTVTLTNGVVGNANTSATFQLDLNGGTLYTPSLTVADRESGGNALLNWNGGTVVATADTGSFVSLYGSVGQNTFVGNGGAIINTFDGTTAHAITITPTLKQSGASTGGLTKLGLGTLTLAGANTYTGNTVISNGTLALSGSGAIGNSANISVAPSATFDVSAVSLTLGASQSLLGSGTINGSVNTTSGSKIYAGGDATGIYATNTFNNDLTAVTGAGIYLDLGTAAVGSNDLINVVGTLNLNSTVFHLKAPSTLVNMSSAADYVLATAGAISGTAAGVPTWDVAPLNAGNFTVTTTGNQVLLHYSASGIAPAITAQPNSTNVFAGATATFSVSAGGTAPLSYQWQGGPVGGPYTNLINGGQVSGAKTNVLTITNVSPNWAMAYQVVVTNAYGSVTSIPANLNLNSTYYLHFTPTSLSAGTGPITPSSGVTSVNGANFIAGDMVIFDALVVDTNVTQASDAWGAVELNQQGGFLGLTAAQLGVLVRTAGANPCSLWVNGGGAGNFPGTSVGFVTNRVRIELTATSAGSTANMNYSAKIDEGFTGTFNSTVSGTGVNFTGNTITLTFGAQNDGMLFTEVPPTNGPPAIGSVTISPSATVYAQTIVTFSGFILFAPAGTTYQWQTDGGNGGVSFTNISGATSTNYILNTSSLLGAYQYQLVATASTGISTSAPVTLTVLASSAPVVATDTTANPNVTTNYIGNTQAFSATFSGTAPIFYQWQFSTSADGSNPVSISGATTTNLVLNNLQITNTGYYSLQASNGIAPFVANTTWTPLTVVVQTTNSALFVWSDPVSCTNLTASQILLGPGGTFYEAAAFNNGLNPITVVAGNQTFTFMGDNSSASVLTSVGYASTALNGNPPIPNYTTGDIYLDLALTHFAYPFSAGGEAIQLKNLVPGQAYMVQLFALDNRNGPTNGVGLRRISFQDPNNDADVSKTFTEGSISYVVGTFVATDTIQNIKQNQLDGDGNMNAVVVFTLDMPPVNTDPATANFKATVSGAPGSQSLNFTWAPDHLGWQLYTNSVGLTATSSWFPMAGSSTVTNESIAINPAKTNVFFQLRYP